LDSDNAAVAELIEQGVLLDSPVLQRHIGVRPGMGEPDAMHAEAEAEAIEVRQEIWQGLVRDVLKRMRSNANDADAVVPLNLLVRDMDIRWKLRALQCGGHDASDNMHLRLEAFLQEEPVFLLDAENARLNPIIGPECEVQQQRHQPLMPQTLQMSAEQRDEEPENPFSSFPLPQTGYASCCSKPPRQAYSAEHTCLAEPPSSQALENPWNSQGSDLLEAPPPPPPPPPRKTSPQASPTASDIRKELRSDVEKLLRSSDADGVRLQQMAKKYEHPLEAEELAVWGRQSE